MDATGALHKNPDNLNVQMCVWNRSYRRPPVVEITAGIRPRVLLQVSKARTHFTKASEHLRAVCSCQRRLRDSHAIWSSHANLNNLKVPDKWIDFACQLLLHLACSITCNITCIHLIKPTVLSCGHKCSEQSWHFKNPIWASFKSSAFASKGTFRTKTVCLPWDSCWMFWIYPFPPTRFATSLPDAKDLRHRLHSRSLPFKSIMSPAVNEFKLRTITYDVKQSVSASPIWRHCSSK